MPPGEIPDDNTVLIALNSMCLTTWSKVARPSTLNGGRVGTSLEATRWGRVGRPGRVAGAVLRRRIDRSRVDAGEQGPGLRGLFDRVAQDEDRERLLAGVRRVHVATREAGCSSP